MFYFVCVCVYLATSFSLHTLSLRKTVYLNCFLFVTVAVFVEFLLSQMLDYG